MTRRMFVSALGASCIAAESGSVPVVVELFTSEGCSSCPPADRVLSELLSQQPFPGVHVVGLSEHVDYWNQLGWTDPFSQHVFSERQSWYSDFFRREGAYTPQMIVDGATEFVGNDVRRARAAILSASRSRKAAATLDWRSDIQIRIARFPDAQQKADVYIGITENGLNNSVPRGENGGRVLHHDGVVRMWRRAAVWNPEADFATRQTVDLHPSWNARNLTAVVFAQERNSRRIIAAASMKAPGS